MTPNEKLAEAIREYVNEVDDDAPVIVRGAVVAWEAMILDEEGRSVSGVAYTAIGDTGPAAMVGLLAIAQDLATVSILDRGDY